MRFAIFAYIIGYSAICSQSSSKNILIVPNSLVPFPNFLISFAGCLQCSDQSLAMIAKHATPCYFVVVEVVAGTTDRSAVSTIFLRSKIGHHSGNPRTQILNGDVGKHGLRLRAGKNRRYNRGLVDHAIGVCPTSSKWKRVQLEHNPKCMIFESAQRLLELFFGSEARLFFAIDSQHFVNYRGVDTCSDGEPFV